MTQKSKLERVATTKNHWKNGRSLKSQMRRENIGINFKKVFSIVPIAIFMMMLLVSCGGGGLEGTYVAKNAAAEQSMYTKFIFKGGKVKIIMGAMGIEMPGGYEYGFKREGDKVSIELGIQGTGMSLGGIELHYNEKCDEISLLFGGEVGTVLNEFAPVWCKKINGQCKCDQNNPNPDPKPDVPNKNNKTDDVDKKGSPLDWLKGIVGGGGKRDDTNADNKGDTESICKEFQTPEKKIEMNPVKAGTKNAFRWDAISCATEYIVHWSFHADGSMKNSGNSGWIKKNEWTFTVPDECGYWYMNVYARDAEKRESKSRYFVSVKVTKDGSIPTLSAPDVSSIHPTVRGCEPISFSWDPVANAQFYIINWSLDGKAGTFRTDETSAEIIPPNVNGQMYIDVFACGSFCYTWVQSKNTQISTKVEQKPQPSQAMDGSVFCNPSEYTESLTKDEIDLIQEFLDAGNKLMLLDKSATIVRETNKALLKTQWIYEVEYSEGNFIIESFDNLNELLNKYGWAEKGLKNFGKVLTGIKTGKTVVDIGRYAWETGDITGSIAWTACEGLKIAGKKYLGFKQGLIWGCKAGAYVDAATVGATLGLGTLAGCITGAWAGYSIEQLIKKIDCKELTTNKEKTSNNGSGVSRSY